MKVLFDECVPRRFRRLLPGHAITTVPEAGWAGIKNGELLRRASEAFEVIVTVDRNLGFQQRASSLPIPVIIIHSPTNKLKDIERCAPELIRLLQTPLSKSIHHVRT